MADTNVIYLLALFLQKKHFFIWLLVSWPTGQHLCTVYKFSFTGSLTLCLGLIWMLLLPLHIFSFVIYCSCIIFVFLIHLALEQF